MTDNISNNDDEVVIISTKNHQDMISCGGFSYRQEKFMQDRIYWCCVKLRHECESRLETTRRVNDRYYILQKPSEHNHLKTEITDEDVEPWKPVCITEGSDRKRKLVHSMRKESSSLPSIKCQGSLKTIKLVKKAKKRKVDPSKVEINAKEVDPPTVLDNDTLESTKYSTIKPNIITYTNKWNKTSTFFSTGTPISLKTIISKEKSDDDW